ncbi:MAG: hypothetical protein ACJAYR_002743 [Sneathiella sp.]
MATTFFFGLLEFRYAGCLLIEGIEMKKLIGGVIVLAALAVTSFAQKSEAAFVGTVNTGEVAYDMLAPGNVIPSPAINIIRHPNWVAAPGSAEWIGQTNGNVSDPAGDYTFSTTFDLTGFDHTTAQINGSVAADNSAAFFLNGNALGINVVGFQALTNFAINNFFVAGENLLEVVVVNFQGSGTNPMGLLIAGSEITAVSAVPLPAALPLYGAGLLAIGYVVRRRKSKA